MNWGYRLRQLWLTLTARPQPADLAWAQQLLGAGLYACFTRLQPSEQVHALAVARQVQAAGHDQPEFLAAALLHDVGKVRYPLWVWERVAIVLVLRLAPQRALVWGRGAARCWRRPFVVAAKHAEWGAQIVREAGAAALVVRLVACHQDAAPPELNETERQLLAVLQAADNDN